MEFRTTTATISAVKSLNRYERALTGISPALSGRTFAKAAEDQVLSMDMSTISGVASRPRKCVVSATKLASKWMIGIFTAQKTLAGTTQLSIRTGEGSLHQRFKDTSTAQRYKRLATTFYTDTLFAKEYSSL